MDAELAIKILVGIVIIGIVAIGWVSKDGMSIHTNKKRRRQ